MPSKDKKIYFSEADASSITFNDTFHKCQIKDSMQLKPLFTQMLFLFQ